MGAGKGGRWGNQTVTKTASLVRVIDPMTAVLAYLAHLLTQSALTACGGVLFGMAVKRRAGAVARVAVFAPPGESAAVLFFVRRQPRAAQLGILLPCLVR